MNWATAIIHGLIWSIIWGLPIILMEIWWPQIWVHDYPKELQKIISLPPLEGRRKVFAYLFISAWLLAVVGFLLWSVLFTYSLGQASFWVLFLHIIVMALIWNLFDLIVMDWLIFCTWHPAFIVLPSSEGHPAYRDFGFHLVGFLKGCVISIAGALAFSGISFGVLNWIVW